MYICRREKSAAEAVRSALAQKGHRIVGCTVSKFAVVQQMLQSGADAFVMDRAMPYLDGEALQKRLSPVPCILIDAENADQIVFRLEELSAQELREDQRGRIKDALLAMGFRPHTRGTRQLQAALEIVLQDERTLADVKHLVYQKIAQSTGTSPMAVERGIRYAIECAWVSGNLSVLQEHFGYTVDPERGKPTNRAFLAQMAEHIHLHRA